MIIPAYVTWIADPEKIRAWPQMTNCFAVELARLLP
jgi:hypothetical protein